MFLYRAAWAAARLAAPLAASGESKRARTVRGRLRASLNLVQWASRHRDTSRPLVWFHAASVGEGRQAEAVLVRLRAARPDWQVAWTFSSASAESLAASVPADITGYLPADTSADTGAALDALRPSALIFSATDLWPELVRQTAARGVRLGLISAALAPTSSRRRPLARALLHDAYQALDAVGAVDRADAEGLAQLGVPRDRITATGDTRHDSAASRVAAMDRNQPALRALRHAGTRAPLLVAGSTWPADEGVLLPALASLQHHRPVHLVIAPHEPGPAQLADLEQRLAGQLPGAALVRLSVLEHLWSGAGASPAPPDTPWTVCVVDRVGMLAELYSAATLAFVGGGFHAAGLHSVIEPAALGVPVLFGPAWRSSRDAGLLLERGGALSAADSGALAAAVHHLLEDDTARTAAGAAARAVVETGLGAADRSLELVVRLVEGG